MPVTSKGTVVKDRELTAINRIVRILQALPEEEQARAVHYLLQRYAQEPLPLRMES